MTSGVVEQLGMATMPLCASTSPALISGTTSGTLGSMRHTPLSSMTTQPRSLAASAISRLMSSFAEMNAMSDSAKTSGVVSSTVSSSPLNSTLFPMERGDAVRRSLSMGKARSSSTAKATLPTAPVAPTMVTLGWATAVSPSPRCSGAALTYSLDDTRGALTSD